MKKKIIIISILVLVVCCCIFLVPNKKAFASENKIKTYNMSISDIDLFYSSNHIVVSDIRYTLESDGSYYYMKYAHYSIEIYNEYTGQIFFTEFEDEDIYHYTVENNKYWAMVFCIEYEYGEGCYFGLSLTNAFNEDFIYMYGDYLPEQPNTNNNFKFQDFRALPFYAYSKSVHPDDNETFLDGYNNGLNDGYINGYDNGYDDGLIEGQKNGEKVNANFGEMLLTFLDAPRQAISNILNFEFLGINLASLVFFIITMLLVILVIKLFI